MTIRLQRDTTGFVSGRLSSNRAAHADARPASRQVQASCARAGGRER